MYRVTIHRTFWVNSIFIHVIAKEHSMKSGSPNPIHPGSYVKKNVLPEGITVKRAAELMGVGRPALSNFLNAKASLSPAMASRLEKVFGANKTKLMLMQQDYEAAQNREKEKKFAVRTYTPSFLNIQAKNIDAWAEKNINARALLAALIRRLIHSSGLMITRSDFPAHDHSQRHGWDGFIESENASAWVPQGLSGWEFGCDDNPTKKANSDYRSRTSHIAKSDRDITIFIFITPRNWAGKDKWLREKRVEGKWKDVRAYDANDLEQWLEQSVPAQVFFAHILGVPADGCQTLADFWTFWAGTTEPPLSQKIFDSAIETHIRTLNNWLNNDISETLVVNAGSKEEALAFVSAAALNRDELKRLAEQGIVVSSAESARRLGAISTQFIPIAITDEADAELARTLRDRRAIVIADKRVFGSAALVSVDIPHHDSFRNALTDMGFPDEDISRYASQCGMSPTILRRLLAKSPALKKPSWASKGNIRDMVTLVLAVAGRNK